MLGTPTYFKQGNWLINIGSLCFTGLYYSRTIRSFNNGPNANLLQEATRKLTFYVFAQLLPIGSSILFSIVSFEILKKFGAADLIMYAWIAGLGTIFMGLMGYFNASIYLSLKAPQEPDVQLALSSRATSFLSMKKSSSLFQL